VCNQSRSYLNHLVLGEEYKLWSSSLCSFLQPPVTSSLFDPNILLNTLLSNKIKTRTEIFVYRHNIHNIKIYLMKIYKFHFKCILIWFVFKIIISARKTHLWWYAVRQFALSDLQQFLFPSSNWKFGAPSTFSHTKVLKLVF
jgi:hypothetical protein